MTTARDRLPTKWYAGIDVSLGMACQLCPWGLVFDLQPIHIGIDTWLIKRVHLNIHKFTAFSKAYSMHVGESPIVGGTVVAPRHLECHEKWL
jgi:hypothetical protein